MIPPITRSTPQLPRLNTKNLFWRPLKALGNFILVIGTIVAAATIYTLLLASLVPVVAVAIVNKIVLEPSQKIASALGLNTLRSGIIGFSILLSLAASAPLFLLLGACSAITNAINAPAPKAEFNFSLAGSELEEELEIPTSPKLTTKNSWAYTSPFTACYDAARSVGSSFSALFNTNSNENSAPRRKIASL